MLLYVVGVVIIFLTHRWYRRSKTIGNYAQRYVVITGCDTGFGNMLTKRLDGMGFHVFAGCLSEKGMKELDAETSPNVIPVRLDVTKTESILSAFDIVKSKLPKDKGLWGVVNNAGIAGAIGPIQWLTKEDYKCALEVNTLGMIETTRIFLPLVLKSKGRIVNITSMMGRIAAANPTYVVSKFATEGYSDVLRREMYKRGVTVHILEPGFFKTPIINTDSINTNIEAKFNQLPKDLQDYYGQPYSDKLKQTATEVVLKLGSTDLHLVIDAYTHALTAKYPNYRYIVGNDARFFFRLMWNLPEWISDFFLARATQIPAAEQS